MENGNRTGAITMLLSVGMGTLSDVIMRIASKSVPTSQILVVRGLIITVILAAVCSFTLSWSVYSRLRGYLIPIRALMDGLMIFLFFLALPLLPFSNLMATFLSSPILAYAISVGVRRQSISISQWAFVLMGFAGVAIIVRPTIDGSVFGAMLALGSALTLAIRDHITRELHASIPSLVISLLSSIAVLIFGFAYSFYDSKWISISVDDWTNLLGSVVLVSSSNIFGVMAFRSSNVALIAPIRYASLPMALALGYFVLGEVPDAFGIMGSSLIFGCGIGLAFQFQNRPDR